MLAAEEAAEDVAFGTVEEVACVDVSAEEVSFDEACEDDSFEDAEADELLLPVSDTVVAKTATDPTEIIKTRVII